MTPRALRPMSDTEIILDRFRDIFLVQWEELLDLRQKVLKTSDPDDIHDLRVASRRFRAIMRLYEHLTRSESNAKLNKNVRKLTQTLGGLRNIDEALLFFRSRTSSGFSADHPIFKILSEARALELSRISAALKTFNHLQLDIVVRGLAAGFTPECTPAGEKGSLPACFSDLSIELYKPIYRLSAVSTVPNQHESRHALRIGIKKWRYFLEIAAQVLDCDYTPVLRLLKDYQSVLGRMNDIAEFAVLCRNLALPLSEQEFVSELLETEDELLLGEFIKLAELKPLTYTFKVK